MLAFWVLALLCVLLLAALWSALVRLQKLQALPAPLPPLALAAATAAAVPAAAAPPAGSDRLQKLMGVLVALDQEGASRAGQLSREAFCKAVLDQACEALGAPRGSLMVFDEHRQVLKALAVRSPSDGKDGARELRSGEGSAGKAFQSGRAVLSPQAEGGEPYISVPLIAQGKAVGTLNLHRDPSGPGNGSPDQADTGFLTLLAREAALTLNNLDLLDSQQTFYLEMLHMLARAADAKDALHGNSDRARESARQVAVLLGMPESSIRHVEYAAMLHRVGKIGVDQTLLNKPGKLTPKEYSEIKKYTAIGHKILSPSKSMGPVAQIILYQQEWFNGQGYPEGLKQDAIPLGSRVVAVINAWEAMRSDRPYRKALDRETAIGELRKGAGTQFDPAVVSAVLEACIPEERAAPAGGA